MTPSRLGDVIGAPRTTQAIVALVVLAALA